MELASKSRLNLILAALIHSFNPQQKRTAVSSVTSKALIPSAMLLLIQVFIITLVCMTIAAVEETLHVLVKLFEHTKLCVVVVV
jgi:hypothetical protein